MKKPLIAMMTATMLLSSVPPIPVNADKIVAPLQYEASSNSSSSSTPGGSSSSSSTSGSNQGSGTGSGGKLPVTGDTGGKGEAGACKKDEETTTGGSGDVSNPSPPSSEDTGGEGGAVVEGMSIITCAEANAQAIIQMGSKIELSAYLIESIQGRIRSTYVPKLEKLKNSEFAYEYKHSALKEDRFFSQDNKRGSIFNQDAYYTEEYIEALNWLYNNDMLHNIESLNLKQGASPDVDTSPDGSIADVSSSGGSEEYRKTLTLTKGNFVVEYEHYGIPDRIKVVDHSGKVIAQTEGLVSGSGKIPFSLPYTLKEAEEDALKEKEEEANSKAKATITSTGTTTAKPSTTQEKLTITIIVNEGHGEEGTVWDYKLKSAENSKSAPKKETIVTVAEKDNKDSYLYPYSKDGEVDAVIPKKDFVMNLMKALDGVEESRALMIENPYDYQLNNGNYETLPETEVDAIRSIFKDQIGATGIDMGINEVSIDFDNYGMHKYYVNPNVYELYFRKAYNNQMLHSSEFRSQLDVKTLVEEFEIDKEGGHSRPKWDNTLPDVRINTIRNVNNSGEYNITNTSGVFGDSWTDISKDNSSEETYGNFNYVDYQYFIDKDISYIDALKMVYKGINAYSDEKLPQREVDTIVSMYSVKYGSLTEEEKIAMNYLIAKGIIDGDDSAKWTSTEYITTKDAMTMIYRVANKDARLTFKTAFGTIDEAMLQYGFTQSKMKVLGYDSEELPSVEVYSDEYDYYYVPATIVPASLGYKLGTSKGVPLDPELYTVETKKLEQDEILRLGAPNSVGIPVSYRIYKIKGDVKIESLGLYLEDSKTNTSPKWIKMTPGGGLHYISPKSMKNPNIDAKFLNLSRQKYSKQELQDASLMVAEEASKSTPKSSVSTFSTKEGEKEKGDKETTPEDDDPLPEKSPIESIIQKDEVDKKKNQDGADNEDPLDILSMGTFEPKRFSEDSSNSESISVYMALNDEAKNDIMFDGRPLLLSGDINPQIVSSVQDVTNGNYLKSIKLMPKVEGSKKVVVEFTFPRTGNRSIADLTSLVKRRMSLTGAWELVGGDIASYTSSANGSTMISQKELKNFGIKVFEDEPDILYHSKTETYAYINAEADYALISNSVVDFPENSTMIEISADDIYYNIEVVMSLLNSDDFIKFNSEGKYEVVSKLDTIALSEVYNPSTSEVVDHTYTATLKDKIKGQTSEKNFGKYVNITAISGQANTFIISHDKKDELKKSFIYGFEPYYYKQDFTGVASASTIVNELEYDVANIVQLENILINNAVLRNEFHLPNEKAFVYTDNALKVTVPHKGMKPEELATTYLDFIRTIVDNMRESDLKEYAKSLNDSVSQNKSSDYSLDLLLDENIFSRTGDATVKKMVSNARKGVEKKQFWALYFISKFNVRVYDNNGSISPVELEKFQKALITEYNKVYKPQGFKIAEVTDLELLKTMVGGDTDIDEARLFSFQPLKELEGGGFITTSSQIYIGENESYYLRVEDFTFIGPPVAPVALRDSSIDGDADSGEFKTKTYANTTKVATKGLNEQEISKTNYQRNILGSRYFIRDGKVYAQPTERYDSLPEGQKPLELYPNGTKFIMETNNGKEQFVIINNSVAFSSGGKEYDNIMVKVARVGLKWRPSGIKGATSYEQLRNYYVDTNNYKNSIKTLGVFSKAVHSKTESLQYTISSSELDAGFSNYALGTSIYFEAPSNKTDVAYVIPTDLMNGLNDTKFIPLYHRNSSNLQLLNGKGIDDKSKLFASSGSNNLNNTFTKLKANNFKQTYLTTGQSPNYVLYDSFLLDYGTVAINSSNEAILSMRSTSVLNSSPVLNDLVNTLVRDLDIERANAGIKTVGDLISGDNLKLPSYGSSNSVVTLVKTSEKTKNGYSEFITKDPSSTAITPNEASYGNILVLKNYGMLDGIKIPSNLERNSLYYYIGNKQLRLASKEDLSEQRTKLNLTNVLSSPVLSEQVGSTKMVQKEVRFADNKVNVADVPATSRESKYKYFMEMYLDSNLQVAKNSNGVYEILGYSSDNLVNTKSWTSRQSKFEGVSSRLVSILPHVNSISGADLGFDTSKFSIQWFLNIFTKEFWNNILDNGVYYLEQFVSVFGIYYLYLLIVIAYLTYTMPLVLSRWTIDPLSIITLGRLNAENLNLKELIPKILLAIMLLSLTYGGLPRVMISKTEDVLLILYDYIIVPLLY